MVRVQSPEKVKANARARYAKNPEGAKTSARAWRARNPEKHRARARAWRARNPEKSKTCARAGAQAWKARNPEKNRAVARAWRKRHLEARAEAQARHRAAKLQALPKWLTSEQLLEIRAYYRQAVAATKMWDIDHVVDHIVPLQGATVCGLHVPWNLQVLTRSENSQKGITLQAC